MKRRQSLTTLLAGLVAGIRSAAAVKSNGDVMEAAAQIIQTQVAAGVLESAVLDVRRGNDVFQRSFGKAASTDALFLLGSITKPICIAP